MGAVNSHSNSKKRTYVDIMIDGTYITPKKYAVKIQGWYSENVKGPFSKWDCNKKIKANLKSEGYGNDYIKVVINYLNNNQP